MAAMSNEDIIQRINTQVAAKLNELCPPGATGMLNRLPTFEASFLNLTGRVDALVNSVDRIDTGFASAMPEIWARSAKVGSAQMSLGNSLEDLTRCGQEVSDKLKESFAQIDGDVEKVKVQAETSTACSRASTQSSPSRSATRRR